MITDFDEYKILVTQFQNELIDTRQNVIKHLPHVAVCVSLSKTNYITTDKTEGVTFEDCGDHYHTHFGQGEKFPEEKVGLAWITDASTIFFFERPFRNKPFEVLKKLLPDKTITFDGNDLMIDGLKVGPSLRTGWQLREGENGFNGQDSDTGHIYCLRWDNLDDLNESFKDSAHHQERLNSKAGLTTLSEHLSITKEEFEKMLESEDI